MNVLQGIEKLLFVAYLQREKRENVPLSIRFMLAGGTKNCCAYFREEFGSPPQKFK